MNCIFILPENIAAYHVQFYRKYDLKHKQGLVAVIQHPVQKMWTEKYLRHSTLLIDFTFEVNRFGLPLALILVETGDGIGLLICFLITSSDKGEQHSREALIFALKFLFEQVRSISFITFFFIIAITIVISSCLHS